MGPVCFWRQHGLSGMGLAVVVAIVAAVAMLRQSTHGSSIRSNTPNQVLQQT